MTDVIALFRELADSSDRCFWLDGGGARAWSGRRSMLGRLRPEDPSLTFDVTRGEVVRHVGERAEVVGDDIFAVLERELDAGPRDAHWVGYLGYGSRSDLPTAPDAGPDGSGMPTAVWMRPSEVRIVDHPPPPPTAPPVRPGPPSAVPAAVPPEYAGRFARVQEALRAGHTYEVNLTHRLSVDSDLSPVLAYLRLRELNPAPYAGFLRHREVHLLSSSPERYATVDRDRWLETRPIKGTTRRGATEAEDRALREHLRTDPKLRAENLMITDLLRNDVGMVSRPGTVEVPGLMEVESYPSVHQLVSTVRGALRPEVSTVSALRALFPAGSMTGAPKLRTMQVIQAVEDSPRGVYAGAFGWLGGDGRADLGVVIRSLTTAGRGRWRLGTGGGITVRSDAAEEYAESRWKAERLLRVFD